MFKEHSANKLIEYIQTLPTEEQRLIAVRISPDKSRARKKKAGAKKSKKDGVEKMGEFLDTLGQKLPVNYKFNREEANGE